MEKNEHGLSSLPLNTFQEIPSPKSNAQSIVALVKEEGRVTGYKLYEGRIVSREDGVHLAKEGDNQGVGIATNRGWYGKQQSGKFTVCYTRMIL